MINFSKFLLSILLLAVVTIGCGIVPRLSPADVVIDQRITVQAGAFILGEGGFRVKLVPVLKELGGQVESVGQNQLLVTLNGKRILVGSGQSKIEHDTQVSGPLAGTADDAQLRGVEMQQVIAAAFPAGTVYQKADKVYVDTGR